MRGNSYQMEATLAGAQSLVPGVAPVTVRDRLAMLADAPLQPRKLQRPADFGLFDMNSRNQLDLFACPAKKEQNP